MKQKQALRIDRERGVKKESDDNMIDDMEDAADRDDRIAALKRNIDLQRRLIENLLARKQSVTIAERMLRRLEARLSKLETTDHRVSEPPAEMTDRSRPGGED
jgi:hypothetical protein